MHPAGAVARRRWIGATVIEATVTFSCVRRTSTDCLRSFNVAEEELQGPVDEHGEPWGDPALLPVLVLPHGWLDDPDAAEDDVFVCCRCATIEEGAQWMADDALVQDVLEADKDDD